MEFSEELRKMIEQHEKEVALKTLEKFKTVLLKQQTIDKSVVRRIAEQMKGEYK